MNARRLLALFLLGAALAPAPAHATITPDAQAVLERYLKAIGGRDKWLTTRSVYGRGKLSAFGLQGSLESWRRAPDKRTSTVSIGPITIKEWQNGDKAWRLDTGGKLLPLDGKDLEQALSSGWFENERWLEPDQGGGAITKLADVTDSLGARAVLEVTPPGGKPRRLEFDKRTGLLTRAIQKNDQVTVTNVSSDYRAVNGTMMSFKSTQEVSGAASNSATVTIDSVLFADIPDDRFSPPSSATLAPVTWLKTVNVARIPFEYLSNHVWVRASVNGGPPADFLYDTGASITVIDSAYAAKIGLQGTGHMQAQGAGSGGAASFATLDRLRIATPDADGVELGSLNVAILNVNSALAPFFWKDCAGVIGFDVINRFVNQVDFDGRNLFLYDPATFTYEGKGTAIPMTLAGHAPVVNVKVDGQYEGGARVDIGSGSMLDLHTPFVKKNDLIAKSKNAVTVVGGGFGGTFESRLARMKSLEIGPYKVNDPLVGLSTTTEGALASEDYVGNLGNMLLDRFRVTLDYERRKIYLEPSAKYAKRPNFSLLGAQLARMDDNKVTAMQVLKDSPAARAGLAEGDEVVSIDGVPVSQLDPDKLEDKFVEGKAGTRVKLDIVRDGKSKKLDVTLKQIL
jgi:hypothetical protein